jgi:hypothetical protein
MKDLFILIMLTICSTISAQVSTSGTTQNGNYSSAIGYYSYAGPGAVSTAMGRSTDATGWASTSMGGYTLASGDASTAIGYYSTASDYASLAIGQYNSSGSSVTNSSTSFSTSNTAFIIGNGVDSSNRSDAFKVMFSGDTYVSGELYAAGLNLGGVDITSSAAELNLLDGVSTIGEGILASVTENGNTGVRLSTADALNHGDIGSNAVDLSNQISTSSTRGATGLRSTAIGYGTTASGVRSLATGNQTFAIGDGSTSMGYDTRAEGYASLAIGQTTTASGTHSTAMGLQTTASGAYSLAIGGLTTASGISSLALGSNTTASGHQSISAGNSSIASASYSTAFGYGSVASDFTSTVIGQYNNSLSSITTNGSATSYNADNTAFVVGNGTDDSNRSDAFKVMFNGDATVSNDLTIIGDVVISSDARLKSNIVSLGSTLSKLLLIDGKSYQMKGKQKIGVLAQEIKKVFPELVTEDENEILAVNYQGLVPVLINALKEQENKVQEQEERIKRLEKLLLN